MPPDLVAARARFDHWRATRSGRPRIPEDLWDLAVEVARSHGVNRTARALGLDYRRLAERVSASPARKAVGDQKALTFVELSSSTEASSLSATPSSPGSECVVELEDRAGTRITIRTGDPRDLDLAALASAFLRKRSVVESVTRLFRRRG